MGQHILCPQDDDADTRSFSRAPDAWIDGATIAETALEGLAIRLVQDAPGTIRVEVPAMPRLPGFSRASVIAAVTDALPDLDVASSTDACDDDDRVIVDDADPWMTGPITIHEPDGTTTTLDLASDSPRATPQPVTSLSVEEFVAAIARRPGS